MMQSFSTLSLYPSLMCSATSCRKAFSMTTEDIEFPVYRKYLNGKNYFKILNEQEFEELQVIGGSVFYKKTIALQYPERLFIRDLLFAYAAMATKSNEEEFESLKKK